MEHAPTPSHSTRSELEKVAHDMGQPLHSPDFDAEEIEANPFVLIRHAYSLFNYTVSLTEMKYGRRTPEVFAVRESPRMIDPPLHGVGELQCENNAWKLHKISFSKVFVSPMQRCLETTIRLFKDHPQRHSIKFVVAPILREVLDTTNDIPMQLDDLKERLKGREIEFDFSVLDNYGVPSLWAIYTLANLEKQ